jgi:hypothetical protein
MATSDLVVSNKNGNATVSISFLLTQEDYDANWAGENGSDGFWTENVQKIHDLFSKYSISKYGIDLQIWEEGNAFVSDVDYNRIEDLKKEIEEIFNEDLEIFERNQFNQPRNRGLNNKAMKKYKQTQLRNISKKLPVKVTIRNKYTGKFVGSIFDSFDNQMQIKNEVKRRYPYTKTEITISQENGFYKTI